MENEEGEDYPFFDEKEDKKIKKVKNEEFNEKCRCPDLSCARHSNCKECQAFHKKRLELTYCGK